MGPGSWDLLVMMPSRPLWASQALLSISDVGFGGTGNLNVSISSITCGLDLERSCRGQTSVCVLGGGGREEHGLGAGGCPQWVGKSGAWIFTTEIQPPQNPNSNTY